MTPDERLELPDVQGLVLSGYPDQHRARYLLLRVGEPARARRWLGDLAGRVTSCATRSAPWCLGVALTAPGLSALGVADDDLATFSPPFQEGMVSPYRSRMLGDVGASDPGTWAWGGPAGTSPASVDRVHVLLLLFAPDEAALAQREQDERARLSAAGLEVVWALTPEPLPGRVSVGKFGVEHFGFADGMSQPLVRGSGVEDRVGGDEARRQVVAAGEFVLGYRNGYGRHTPSPRLRGDDGVPVDLGRNGTYLVFRQLAQDVEGFEDALDRATRDEQGGSRPEEAELLAAKLVGRWRSGAPLVRSPHRDDPALATDNAFGYAAVDPDGDRCPLGAHVRRANPRDGLSTRPATALQRANLHRVLRRGRVYGEAPAERGLLFVCLGANLERQFEFIQSNWCMNPSFNGLTGEQDPLLGSPEPGRGAVTLQGSPFATRVVGLSSFVTVRGGGYFFLPGLQALRRLAALPG